MTTRDRAFFGDADHDFHLTDAMIEELERITGAGIGTLYLRVAHSQYHARELVEIIRLGLIGGGMNPQRAAELAATYAKDRPLAEIFGLALDVLDALFSGKPDEVAA
ncbi:gene transfer agent family protein [Paracoccus salipaludis]|uniref:Gene transfer agent family protein n=1 Tax=Paracoccus salipaludis TaxID=2032623 RepID=A0A2A2GPH7_9RHOB|nr:gene transfer agent family protein [Paracoccus salipaludis]PAU98957.1 hypothetical protein CK240_02185 [Paracoccus salipaludis]